MDEVEVVYKVLENVDHGTMVDVGAHHGQSLAPFARQGWAVYAFEPDDENRKCLREDYGTEPNVIIDKRAVSNEKREEMPFYRSHVSSGISGLSDFHSSHNRAGTVNTITLGEYFRGEEISHVDFLKVDTEGHDLMVLKSVPWTSVRPKIIVCEFENSKSQVYGYKFEDLANYLDEKGYRTIVSEWYPVVEYGRSHRWRTYQTYPCSLKNPDAWGNIIALKDKNNLKKAKKYLRIGIIKKWIKHILPIKTLNKLGLKGK